MAPRLLLFALLGLSSGCAGLINNAAADALSGTGTVLSSDDDPDFIAQAVPFGLKTMDAVLERTPEHKGLLLALASGYTQYGYAFLEEDADRLEDDDYEAAQHLRSRARKMYERAQGYGRRLVELRSPGFFNRLEEDHEALFSELGPEDVPALYWTAAAWALGVAASELDPDAIADFPLVERMARGTLALDEDWDDGALHLLLLSIESAKPGGDLDAAAEHFERALELDGGRRAGTYVSMAGGVCVPRQDVVRFHDLLEKAIAVDEDAHPADRLANVIMKRRAERLLEREEDLFVVSLEEARSSTTAPRGP
ncbi:MAG: TRAP transporter TatT component family protein [Myxococcota bacterium]